MAFCANKNLPEWKALYAVRPEDAEFLWDKYNGNVPQYYYSRTAVPSSSVEVVSSKSKYRPEYGEKATKDIVATLSKMLIDKKDLEGFSAKDALGTGANKGDIANYFLMNAYSTQTGEAVSLDVARALYDVEAAYYRAVESGDQARIAEATAAFNTKVAEVGPVNFARPTFFNNPDPLLRNIFFDIYNNWNTKVDTEFENITTIGWRDLLADKMTDFGVIVKNSNEESMDFEDDDSFIEKIYGKSSLENDPADALTGRVKEVLSKVEDPNPNFLGYKTYIARDEVYKEVLNVLGGSLNYQTMYSRIENLVAFKPKYAGILKLLTELEAADKAAFRSAFSLTSNQFLLHLESEVNKAKSTRIINPNEKSIERTEVTSWKSNAVEGKTTKERALYTFIPFDSGGQSSAVGKPDVILTIGTSGSGKSTWIRSVNRNNKYVVISPDKMRVEFTGDINDKSKDKEIYEEAANRAIEAIKEGKPVIFDTTNLTKDKRRPFINAIKNAIPSANIQYKLMPLDAELAKQRIKDAIARGVNRANVSEETIDRHAASYKEMLEDIKSEDMSNYETGLPTGIEKEGLNVKEDKARAIVDNYIIVQEAIKAKQDITSQTGIHPTVTALANVLWNMSMNIGDDTAFEQTAANLQSYFNTGVTVSDNGNLIRKAGIDLMNYYVNRKDHELAKLVTKIARVEFKGINIVGFKGVVEKPVNIFGVGGEQKTIRHLASITPLFKSVRGTSFTNGMNSAVYDTNIPTTLNNIITTLKSGTEEAKQLLQQYMADPFMNPDPLVNNIHTSVLLRLLHNPKYLQEFTSYVYDSTKNDKDFIAYIDYGNFRKGDSLLTRLNSYANNGNKVFFLSQIPTEADRKRLDQVPFVRIKALTSAMGIQVSREDIIKGFIIQDLARIAKAKSDIDNAEFKDLVEGYHYTIKTNPDGTKVPVFNDDKGNFTGRAFAADALQLDFKTDGVQMVTDRVIPANTAEEDSLYPTGNRQMSDMVNSYLDGSLEQTDLLSYGLFMQAMNEMVEDSLKFFNDEAKVLKDKILELGIADRLAFKEIEEIGGLEVMLRDFVFDEFVGRTELVKLVRGSRAYTKDLKTFYKRMSALTTPKQGLTLEGEVGVQPGVDGEYGMMRSYNSAVIRDSYLRMNPQEALMNATRAMELGDKAQAALLSVGISPVDAAKVANRIKTSYDPNISEIVGTDGQGYISIDMYRKFKQGKGQWYRTHEAAYKEYKLAQREGRPARFQWQKGAVPKGMKAGDNILIEPIKPYYERLSSKNRSMVPISEKNGWRVLLEEGTQNNPIMNDLRQRMELTGEYAGRTDLDPIHVVNVESARKFSKSAVYQIQGLKGEFESLYGEPLDSRGLGLAQDINNLEKNKVVIGVQIKKNAIANIVPGHTYVYNAGLANQTDVKGSTLAKLYHEAFDHIAKVSTKGLFKELKIDKILEAQKIENISERFKAEYDARLEALKTIRDILQKENLERQLPSNYDDALNIVVDSETGMPRFTIPLDFPVYQNKFQQILFGMFNNQVFKQKALGMEAVQFAEFGGTEESDNLFYTIGTDLAGRARVVHMEIEIREDLARKFNIKAGDDLMSAGVPEELLRMIGYRIPNQSKASTVIFKVKRFLPANYAKAAKVPGQITKLMGSDFDIDKLLIMAPFVETAEDGTIYKMNLDHQEAVANGTLKGLLPNNAVGVKLATNFILDTIEAVMSNPMHIEEVMSPLDESTSVLIVSGLLQRNPGLANTTTFSNVMSESEASERNMIGNTMKGLWNNALSGRNVLAAGTVFVTDEYLIKLDGKKYDRFIEKIGPEVNPVDSGKPTSNILERRISSAVDAASKGNQYEMNDNVLTYPVANYWINFVGDDFALTDFLNQPIVRSFIDLMYNEYGGDISNMDDAYKKVMKNFNLSPTDINKYAAIGMSREALTNISPDKINKLDQQIAMNNFMKFYKAGAQLGSLMKIVTPDTAKGMNSISMIEEYKDKRSSFDDESGSQAFRGGDKLESPVTQFLGEQSVYGMEKTYDNMSDSALTLAGLLFPANVSAGVENFKTNLKANIGKTELTAEQHRDISRNLMLRILMSPRVLSRDMSGKPVLEDSPLADFFTPEHTEVTYKSTTTNLAVRLDEMKTKYPALLGNSLISNLGKDDANDDEGAIVYLIRFDNSFNFTRGEKDIFTGDFRKLLYSPAEYANNPSNINEVEEIKQFAEDLAANSIRTRGFDLGSNSYTDIVPLEFWTNPRVNRYGSNAGKVTAKSPVEFFMSKLRELNSASSLTDELFDFVRANGFMRHGGKTLLNRKKLKTLSEAVHIAGKKDTFLLLYGIESRDAGIYMRSSGTATGSNYVAMQPLGLPKKLIELTGESMVHPKGATSSMDVGGIVMLNDDVGFQEDGENIQCT